MLNKDIEQDNISYVPIKYRLKQIQEEISPQNLKKGMEWHQPKTPEMLQFEEEETGRKAIYHNKITGIFIYWLSQKIKYKTLICDICGRKDFTNKRGLNSHRRWHDLPEYKEFQEKCREKDSITAIKQWHNPEYRESMTGENHPNYGKLLSDETKKQIGDKNRGKNSPMWGKHHTDKTKKIMSNKKKGENNPNWDENGLHYDYIHKKADIADPKPVDGICEYCHKVADEKGRTELVHSNKDHSYNLPINPDEWWWIHRSCNMEYDSKKGLR